MGSILARRVGDWVRNAGDAIVADLEKTSEPTG